MTTAAVYGLARLSFLGLRPVASRLAAAAIAIVAFLAPFHVLEIGRATGDDTSGGLVLLGLLVVVGAEQDVAHREVAHFGFELDEARAVPVENRPAIDILLIPLRESSPDAD